VTVITTLEANYAFFLHPTVDFEWMMKKLEKSDYKCYYCKCCFEFNINKEDKITSTLSFDRIDNSKSHIKSNCVVACVLCNTSKSNK
jgi:hypothetical protein